MSQEQNSLTHGPILPALLRFALPLFLGNLFQQLYNAVDSLVVGNFCGNDALAAVSSSGSLCHLLIGFFQGVFVGASVLISRFYGAKEPDKVDRAVHTTLLFSLVFGLVLTALGIAFTPALLRLMGTPDNVLPNSITYFRIYCAGLLGLVLYNTTNGIFQALGDSRHPLYYLIISSVVNVVLDLLFVGWMKMGVAGAALATVIGQALSALLGLVHLCSGKFLIEVSLSHLKPDFPLLGRVLHLGLPSGVQNSVISIANLVVQSNINAFGDQAMAGCGSYSKIEAFVFLPITCMTLAMTTFTSQNLGAGRIDRVRQGAKTGLILLPITAEVIGLAFFALAPFLVGLFSRDPDVIAFGARQARIEALFYCCLAFSHGCAALLRGAGRAVTPMAVMLVCWCLFRICYITAMVFHFQTITVVFTAYPVTWTLSSLLFAIALWKGDWLHHA